MGTPVIERYLKSFAHLRTDQSPARWTAATCHRAPHKPLLLLAVLDLFAEGTVKANIVEVTPDLSELFNLYWSRVMSPDQRGNLALPFFHLKSDGFWHLVPRPGEEMVISSVRQVSSVHQLREMLLGAQLDDDLYALLQSGDCRDTLRAVLLETYFAPEVRSRLVEQGVVNVQSYRYGQVLLDKARTGAVKEVGPQDEQYAPVVRDQGFRRAVVSAYNHRCALCGIRMLTSDGHTAVDAAHIVPWSISHSDDPRNGMGLCRLCHWVFDEGLVGVSSAYVVVAAHQLSSDDNVPGHLLTLFGRSIIGPVERSLWPDTAALEWHHHHVFRSR